MRPITDPEHQEHAKNTGRQRASLHGGGGDRAAEAAVVRAESGELKDLVQHDGFDGIVAGSDAMRRILNTVRTVANSTIPVLITGESGTGKELIAKAVHTHEQQRLVQDAFEV